MKVLRKKFILAGLSIAMLVVTLVTTTYAWFSMNDSAWVDGFDLDIVGSDSLLISYEDGTSYKQSLSNEDVVAAMNALRDETHQISSLKDIQLEPVTSFTGMTFKKQLLVYDENNVRTTVYKDADENTYVKMKLYFKMDAASVSKTKYELHFKSNQNDQVGGLQGTSFKGGNQTIQLLNSLMMQDGDTRKNLQGGESIVVNPVNALRMSVKGASNSNQTLDRIFEVADEKDLGSYAFSTTALDSLHITDARYQCDVNPMYTYFNNIHNNCLEPMDFIAENPTDISDLLTKRLTNKLDDSLGVFTYDEATKSYNTIAIEIGIWVEGFDADNLIGLKTSSIGCLLTFEVRSIDE